MPVIEQQTIPHIYKEQPGPPPKPDMMSGQQLTCAKFEPMTLGFTRADHSNLPYALTIRSVCQMTRHLAPET